MDKTFGGLGGKFRKMFGTEGHEEEQEQEQEQEQEHEEEDYGQNELQNVITETPAPFATPTRKKKASSETRTAPPAPRKKSKKVASDASAPASAPAPAVASASAHTKTKNKTSVPRPPLKVGASKTLPSAASPIEKKKRARVGHYPKAAYKEFFTAAGVLKKGNFEAIIAAMDVRDEEFQRALLVPAIANMIACGRKTLLQEDFKAATDQLGITFIASQV
jgi:hypothetical protein